MNKNIIDTLACEEKELKPSHEITSIIKTFIQKCNKE
jgi:hypothetical protein